MKFFLRHQHFGVSVKLAEKCFLAMATVILEPNRKESVSRCSEGKLLGRIDLWTRMSGTGWLKLASCWKYSARTAIKRFAKLD
jgi:hypothetical protein